MTAAEWGASLGAVLALILAAFFIMLALGAVADFGMSFGACILIVLGVRGLSLAWKGAKA